MSMIFSEERKLINKKKEIITNSKQIFSFLIRTTSCKGGGGNGYGCWGVGSRQEDQKKPPKRHDYGYNSAFLSPCFCIHVCTQTTFISPIFPRKNGVVVEVSSFFKRKDTTTVKDFFFSFGDEREIKACKK
jgi:hypothetical protein